jgi:hypothetical protein
MSAHDLRDLERNTNRRGVDLYLSKPLTGKAIAELGSRLDFLRRRARAHEVESP